MNSLKPIKHIYCIFLHFSDGTSGIEAAEAISVIVEGDDVSDVVFEARGGVVIDIGLSKTAGSSSLKPETVGGKEVPRELEGGSGRDDEFKGRAGERRVEEFIGGGNFIGGDQGEEADKEFDVVSVKKDIEPISYHHG